MSRNRQHYFRLQGYDPKKMVYTMLSSGFLTRCECSVINNNPVRHRTNYLMPKDVFVGKTITDKNVGAYSDFLVALRPYSGGNILQCVCALDEKDRERVVYIGLSKAESIMSFHTARKSRHKPEIILKRLKSRYGEII